VPRAIRDAAFEIGFRRAAKEEAIAAGAAVRPAAGDVGQFENALVLTRRRRKLGLALLVSAPPPSPPEPIARRLFVGRPLSCRRIERRLIGIEPQPVDFSQHRRAR
jgi:hypothetical protein